MRLHRSEIDPGTEPAEHCGSEERKVNGALVDYYRCPEVYTDIHLMGEPSKELGYFRIGRDTICYGRPSSCIPADNLAKGSPDVLKDIRVEKGTCFLPFNLQEIIDNLRYERYSANGSPFTNSGTKLLLRDIYYLIRPILPIGLRKHLQALALLGWQKTPFPNWPVDRSVEAILKRVLESILSSKEVNVIPFIWFWPEGHSSCLMITHDVETSSGRDFCSRLMDMEGSFGVKSSFGVIPEGRYEVSRGFLDSIRTNGCEVYIHGLNHDGRLFRDRREFLRRVERINCYAEEYGATGFRSPVMYRNTSWYDSFGFSYDMSMPNVGHLEAQKGGCCTVMPYWIGKILELPLTTIQDYWLYNILKGDSIELWKLQIGLIVQEQGLISFNIHPDYTISKKARYVYESLLEYLSQLCDNQKIWIALPKEIDSWLRQRNQLQLVRKDGKWSIDGPGKERARLAYVLLEEGQIVYKIQEGC